ncbi:MAG: 50S ribosomal protein L15 [Chloroflexi bacterium]|jgi:large subunit ribosomal protein L15|nr:50S ribosomal protein L15 [Anaerolineaceae bacterium]NMB87816.1 50S ribosomal protein L15 [Chloroflexota bacterium]
MKLNDLKPNEGAKKERKRVGRGIAAGQGKTAGHGTKGEGARSGQGGSIYRQGGNLPFYRRLPFIRGEGFTPPNRVEYNEVSVEQLARFEAKMEVTPAVLVEARLVNKPKNPVVILGNGEINVPLTVRVHRVTKSAREKIEAAGGSVEIIADGE